ncbi:hypothetical protein FJZ31_29995 [Candidatus Poribacteria bacterium]|nr:hypothetical protein [Candidatus Poribacteria bacterium]
MSNLPINPLVSPLSKGGKSGDCDQSNMAADGSPFADAVAVWHMADLNDMVGKNSRLTAHGEVKVGVELKGVEREASIKRGGDGCVAEFWGGYFNAGQGADGELNLEGKALSLCIRLRNSSGNWNSPLFSKHGGSNHLVYNLFSTNLNTGVALAFELGTDWNESPLQVSVPVAMIGPTSWHDVVVRFTGPKLELFIDGVLVDEEWPIGSLRQGNLEPCLIGASSCDGEVKAGFWGMIDHVALWNRALLDDEIEFLSGGEQEIASREFVCIVLGNATMANSMFCALCSSTLNLNSCSHEHKAQTDEHKANDTEILGEPGALSTFSAQYWRPKGHNTNVGDCMPFFHDGIFHLFYLFDRRHHRSKWGLGAHQWAHTSTTDLIHWKHHPMAIPITEQWESSICTGSVFFHNGTYYGFYATRMPDRTQHLGLAISTDGINFQKTEPNPFASPEEGYDPMHYRDPEVFQDKTTGLFHMLVTARLTDGRDGCLAQLVSNDLRTWQLVEPFIIPGRVTDCSHHFEWNGWYYLFAEYVYWMSRQPLGPWIKPEPDRLDVLYVPKTAAFKGNRRIYVSWLPDGGWGGNAIFRELIQHEDGTLGTKFPSEMIPRSGDPVDLPFKPLTEGVTGNGKTIRVNAPDGFAAAMLTDVPHNVRITLQAKAELDSSYFGLCVRGTGHYQQGCELRFEPASQTFRKNLIKKGRQRVQFGVPKDGRMGEESGHAINHVEGLERPFTLDIILQDDIVDVCINNRRTIIGRYKGDGDRLFFFGQNANVVFDAVEIRQLLK